MLIHTEPHPFADKPVRIKLRGLPHQRLVEGCTFEVHDWVDRLPGNRSWTDTENWATYGYALRMGLNGFEEKDAEKRRRLTHDLLIAEVEEVVYGKIFVHPDGKPAPLGLGYIVHNTEIDRPLTAKEAEDYARITA